jgi:hypothetical protein
MTTTTITQETPLLKVKVLEEFNIDNKTVAEKYLLGGGFNLEDVTSDIYQLANSTSTHTFKATSM